MTSSPAEGLLFVPFVTVPVMLAASADGTIARVRRRARESGICSRRLMSNSGDLRKSTDSVRYDANANAVVLLGTAA
jgi:hypothetical protein